MQPRFPADHHFHRRPAVRPASAEPTAYDRRQRVPALDPTDPRSDTL
jgi:hypothetical protein